MAGSVRAGEHATPIDKVLAIARCVTDAFIGVFSMATTDESGHRCGKAYMQFVLRWFYGRNVELDALNIDLIGIGEAPGIYLMGQA